jgi:hypothetical protein
MSRSKKSGDNFLGVPSRRGPFEVGKKFFLALIVLGVLGGTAIALVSRGQSPDKGPTNAYLIFLIDLTDKWPDASKRAFWQEMSWHRKNMKAGDILSIYVIQAREPGLDAEPVEVFRKRRPEDGSNTSIATGNPEMDKKRFENEFAVPLQKILGDMNFAKTARTTPLLETLRMASTLLESVKAERRDLFIFSNMLENDRISFYKLPLPKFEKLNALGLRLLDVKGALREVNVTAYRIPAKHFREEAGSWWQDYFNYAGALNFEMKTL